MVKDWTKEHWAEFLKKIPDFDPQVDLRKFDIYSPLIFILENHYLPQLFPSKQIMADIDRLEISSPDLTGNEFTDINMDFDREEILLLQSIQLELDLAESRKKWISIQKSCEVFLEKYPHNEIVPFYLYDAYNKLGYTNKAYQLITNCYNSMPHNQKSVVQYLSTLLSQNKPNLIKQFLAKGFLLEDHLPSQYKFKIGQFHFYYFELTKFLFEQGQWLEGWRLMNWFISEPLTKENEAIEAMWRFSYFAPAFVVYKEICDNKKDKGFQNKLIDSLFAACGRLNNP